MSNRRDVRSSPERAQLEALRSRLGRGSALFETVLDQLTLGLVVVDASSGRILVHNEEAARFLRRASLPADVERAADLATGAERPDGRPYPVEDLPVRRALRGEAVRQEEMVYPDAEGGRIHLWVSAAPVRDEDGNVHMAIATIEDVSDRKAQEIALREKEEELERVNAQLLYDTLHDALTGLPNRVLLVDRLQQILRRRKDDPGHDAAVLFLDFDRFKIVNDSLGHAVGDAMLVAISRVLKSVVRPEDTVARLGGDEFVVLADHVDARERSVELAKRIERAFATPIRAGDYPIYTSASIGIVPSLFDYDDADALLRDADTAMYEAKAAGRGRHAVFDARMRERVIATLDLETDLHRALEREEFRVLYAPIHRVGTGGLAGFEALVRWDHPRRGLLAPAEFLSVATELGMTRRIDHWVWREAARTVSAWRRRFDPALLLSLNVSPQHFLSPDPEGVLLDVLREAGAGRGRTIVELDETALHQAPVETADALRRLSERGVAVHLDDFGAQNASLYNLQRFSIDALKIDRGIVAGMTRDTKDAELVRVVLGLAGELGLEVVAEGVEDEVQLARLEALGCAYAQGYLFSAPMDAEEAVRYLEAHAARSASVETAED